MQPTRIGAIIFDLGGVLLDWNPRYLYRRYFENAEQMEAFLKEVDFSAWNRYQDAGRSFAEAVDQLSAQFPHHASLIHGYHERWEESVAGPIDGTVLILRGLKTAGRRLFALTNWSAETFPIAYKKYPFLQMFESIVVSGEERLLKPDPRIMQLAAQRAGFPESRCLLIDDSPPNIAAAAGLGFQTIRFTSVEALETSLIQLQLLSPHWKDSLHQ